MELTRFRPTRTARVDYPFDNVILRLPVETSYRYTKTVVYQEGEPIRDPEPSTGRMAVPSGAPQSTVDPR